MTSMVPLTSQRPDFWRQWSSSTSRVQSNAPEISRNPTGAAHMNHRMETTAWWLSLPMQRKKPSCHLLETWKKKLGDATTKTIFTVLVELPTHLQSSCSAILLIRYRCHAIRTYRYGTDRIGSIVVKMATMEQHVLMCMCGMLKKRRTDKVLKWCKFNFKNGTDNINVNTALIYLRWHYIL